MGVNQRAIRWLRAELPTLVSSGTISDENAKAIERYYEASAGGGRKTGVVLLAAVGSILVAAGIVLLIAHNWDEFSRPVRSVIAFLPLIAAQALSVFVLMRRNESKAWRECAAIFNVAAIGTAISLVSQTYQITGSLANFIFVWLLLSIPLVYLMRTTLGAVAYLIGTIFWLFARNEWRQPDLLYFWMLLLLVVPYFTTLFRRDRGSRETGGLAIVIALAAAIGSRIHGPFCRGESRSHCLCRLLHRCLHLGIEFFPATDSGRLHLLALLAGVAIGVMTIVLTFEGIWRHQPLKKPIDLPHGISIAIELSFPIVAVALAVWLFRAAPTAIQCAGGGVSRCRCRWLVTSAVVCPRASSFGRSRTDCDLWAAILLNVYALGLGVELIARGLRANSTARTNFGLLVIAALGVARFFDSDLSFVTRAIGFIAIGVGLSPDQSPALQETHRRMNKLRLIIFILVALTQIAVPASMIWQRQRTLREGRLWKFRTAPVDPVDVMRGRYLVLRFEAESFVSAIRPESHRNSFPYGGTVYVKLKEDAEGFAVVDQADEIPMEGDDVVKAEGLSYYDKMAHVRFPFDRLWVNEASAPAAEKAYAEHSRREKVDAYATVRVHNGDAGIEELYIAGQPLREYLRAHPP